jgi:hypothetical protein
MFYGANSASLRDPFGRVWVLLTWKKGLDPAEMERRGTALLRDRRAFEAYRTRAAEAIQKFAGRYAARLGEIQTS